MNNQNYGLISLEIFHDALRCYLSDKDLMSFKTSEELDNFLVAKKYIEDEIDELWQTNIVHGGNLGRGENILVQNLLTFLKTKAAVEAEENPFKLKLINYLSINLPEQQTPTSIKIKNGVIENLTREIDKEKDENTRDLMVLFRDELKMTRGSSITPIPHIVNATFRKQSNVRLPVENIYKRINWTTAGDEYKNEFHLENQKTKKVAGQIMRIQTIASLISHNARYNSKVDYPDGMLDPLVKATLRLVTESPDDIEKELDGICTSIIDKISTGVMDNNSKQSAESIVIGLTRMVRNEINSWKEKPESRFSY